MHLGLIGKSLSHSFSKLYFDKKFDENNLSDFSYTNFELNSVGQFSEFIQKHNNLRGLNITTPYKEEIIPYLEELDEVAKKINAVNCIKIANNKLTGYNTDAFGFRQSIKPFLEPKHNKALILGTGGSSKAIAFTLDELGIEYYFVTSSNKKPANCFFYEELNEIIISRFLFIINCTPLGMFPEILNSPVLPFEFITKDHLAYDLIYNPAETLFLKKCNEKGAICVNGLSMLQWQAEKSWEIWNSD